MLLLVGSGIVFSSLSERLNIRIDTLHLGGASGIGLGITRSFAEQGAHISVLDVNSDGASIVQALSTEFPSASFSFKHSDISNWDDLAASFEQIHQEQGRIDIVMANAGISKEASLIADEEKPSKPVLKTLDVNLIGTIYSESCSVSSPKIADLAS